GRQVVLAAYLGFAVCDVDPAFRIVPGGDAMAPPQLAADAPVLDVAQPGEIGVLPVLRHELHLAFLDDADRWLGQRLHRHVPLVGQEGLDDRATAVAARNLELVRLDFLEQAGVLHVADQLLAAVETVETTVGFRRVVVDGAVGRQDVDQRQLVALADLVVVEVVRRGDFHAAGTELRIDVAVGDDRDAAVTKRQLDFLADEVLVALVFRVDGYGGITEQGFRTRRRDDDVALAVPGGGTVAERVAEVPEAAVLFLGDNLEIGDRGVQLGVPVDEA